MPTERLSMRKVREVLRLKHAVGLSYREISEATGVGKTAVYEYIRRAEAIGITWPVAEEIDDATLERRLFACPGALVLERDAVDWAKVHEELKRRGVTLLLLWQEYRAGDHVAGEKLFVDFAGVTIEVFDAASGQVRVAHIFIAALGASNYTYAEARWSEGLLDWIGAHVNALTALGGVPKAVVCDNLKAGVTKPSRYEPGINRTYQDLADHYGFVVLPTRVRKPRDKAKVEVAVLIVERWVLARLRNRRFFSLEELNTAIRDAIADLNNRVMRKLGKSRRELFETLDRGALAALPDQP